MTLRKKFQESDPGVKSAFQQAQVARKALRQLPAYDQYTKLQRELAEAKKTRQNTLKRLARNDPTLRGLRAESKLMSTRIKKLKKDIRDARIVTPA